MQTIEAGDKVVVFAGEGLGWGHFKVHSILNTRLPRLFAGRRDRGVVVVEAKERAAATTNPFSGQARLAQR